ncbi:hypothetical protein AX16_010582 [Volvariella volvacea WC 439]|nr:hypothetical protein AX16_010582 [Volvariella volvacea WC 439]
MSEPELYMPDTNESFDLPRWQTHLEPLSSSAQSSNPPQPSYLYSGAPPPPPLSATSPQRLQSAHQSPTGPSRQPRISQLLDQDQQIGFSSSQYLSTGQSQLSRSASLGGNATANSSLSSRTRRQHPQDDLEGALNTNNQNMSAPRQQHHLGQNSFYPPSIAYQPPSLTAGANPTTASSNQADSYSDMYFTGPGAHPPKRSQTTHDASTSGRGGRSPIRGPTTPGSSSLLDPYSQQAQYSPTTANYSAYGPPQDQRNHPPPASTYHSHNRGHSQMKTESMTPPLSANYPPSSALHNSGNYSSSYAMDTTSPNPSTQSHLNPHAPPRQTSISNPSTPLSYTHTAPPPVSHFYAPDQSMLVDVPPQKRRPVGFRRVRGAADLQPRSDVPLTGRRMGSDGTYLSPLRQLTTNLIDTYHICNPSFRYESAHNPRRVLTKPSKPAHNEGYDNDDYDYILYVNDWLGTEEGHKYLILDILGQGTFGQVVKCQNMKTHEIVAVKVVKNKPAYFNQSMMEVTILELLNKTCDPNDEHHILRLRDSFIHRNHLCLVFELLSSNLYELIKQNQFQGLSTQLVKVFMAQLLDAMTVLKEARLIHCDLKPENILLKSLQSPQIKVIDFGSACHERQTVYTYIQSRFYRSPEVLLGMSYTAAIDMWSLGCIAVELFLGLPLFPGTSEYNQLCRIIDMLGLPPQSMLNTGKQVSQFFDTYEVWNAVSNQNEKRYKLKSLEQYSREHNTNEQPGKQYFKATTLPEIINTAPMPNSKTARSPAELEKELNNRASFINFCQGLLDLNPVTRWTPQQARQHPFITGEKYTKPFVPDGIPPIPAPSAGPDPKRPYGGLVPSQPKGARAYQDAATYNQHLAQHQAYTAQQASQNANTYRNPYINAQAAQPAISSPSYTGAPEPSSGGVYSQQSTYPSGNAPLNPPLPTHRTVAHQSSGQVAASGQYGHGHPPALAVAGGGSHLSHNPPANSYYPNNRNRSNTINHMDNVPPALARLQHMNQDVIGGRNALTPVLNRDDAMREWERRQSGKAAATQPYPQLEYLQQQAEAYATSGMAWGHGSRYQHQPSKLSHSYHPPPIIVDDEGSRRDAIMSNVRSAARNEAPNGMYTASSSMVTSPPQTYAGSTTSNTRYATTTYTQQQPQQQSQHQPAMSSSGYEAGDHRADISNLFTPMQPDQYGQYPASSRMAPPANVFYGSGVVPQSGGQRNPFQVGEASQSSGKDLRRGSGMDAWTR